MKISDVLHKKRYKTEIEASETNYLFRIINDEILERTGGFLYDKKSNKFLISKQKLQLENVIMHLFVTNYIITGLFTEENEYSP